MTLSPKRAGTDVGYECFTHFYPHHGLRALIGGRFSGFRLMARTVTGWSAAPRGLYIVMLISLCLLPVAARAQDGMPTANPEMPAAKDEAPVVAEEAVPAKEEVAPASVEAAPASETAAPIASEPKEVPASATSSSMQIPVAAVPAEKPVDPGVPVDHFEFSYGLQHPALPPLDELKDLSIKTTQDGKVYRAPAARGAENVLLSGIPQDSQFDSDALREVAQEVVRWYNSRGLYGVWVAYTDLESSVAGVVDNRSADNKSAHLVIWASQIDTVRTLARGKRIKSQDSINHRKHRRIIKYSPLHPAVKEGPGVKAQPGSLFSQEVLDDYLYGLSLHPGRRVEASIASAGEPGKVVLDYLVNEAKTWQIFSQFNNYGTESTGKNRGRLGFQHSQLTNHDDILNFDVISTTDLGTYGAFLSYRIPLWRPAKLIARVYGSYGDFLATQAGSAIDLRYVGQNWLGGLEFSNRLSLWHDWQLLSVAGANFNHYAFTRLIVIPALEKGQEGTASPLSTGESDFLVPFLGTTLSREFSWGALSAGVRFDKSLSGVADDDPTTGYPNLGRREADPEWTAARWNFQGTVYLDPMFTRSRPTSLAHEFSVRVNGRTLLDGRRLIPHEQEALGGALSVRGYKEALVSADEFIEGTVEYAYHIPRSLKPAEAGTLFRRPFKWRPKEVGQNPDWDLVFRVFYDSAYRSVNPPLSLLEQQEKDPTKKLPYAERSFGISGAGVGIALVVKQNFSLRVDYGQALTTLEDEDQKVVIVKKGDKELYLLTSFSW
jgi:hemolysin activation/secretion protein